MNRIPESHVGLLENNQVVMLATNGPKGEPQVTALWFLYEDGKVKMSINESRQKLKNLRRDARASVLFIDPANPYKTLEIRGTVDIESDPDYAFADRVGKKYGANLRDMDKPGESRAMVTVNPEKVHSFGE